MPAEPNRIVQEAVDVAIGERGEIGLQVAAYLDGKLVVDAWGGLADENTGREVDADTLFPVFSVTKAVTAVALHIQAERGLVDYAMPIAYYWPEFGAHGKDKGTVYDALTHRLGVPIMPLGVTPGLMCDWDWMVQRIADMWPLFEPGTKAAYMSYTFGWVIGEVVRRTDPRNRPFDAFVQEEICQPLGLDSLWMGIPHEVEPRVAKLTNMPPIPPGAPGMAPAALSPLAIPAQVGTTEEVFGRPDVRRACIPGAGGIMNARSAARFFAMLAQGGELDGVRLLSKERVRWFSVPRPPCDYDYVQGVPHNGSIGGFHLVASIGNAAPPLSMAPAGRNPRTFGHPGAGGSIGWADPDTHLAVAITHNRMFRAMTPEENPLVLIGQAVRKALGVSGNQI
jgi:CubicO group peptidase (beta-lactamase class C family)